MAKEPMHSETVIAGIRYAVYDLRAADNQAEMPYSVRRELECEYTARQGVKYWVPMGFARASNDPDAAKQLAANEAAAERVKHGH